MKIDNKTMEELTFKIHDTVVWMEEHNVSTITVESVINTMHVDPDIDIGLFVNDQGQPIIGTEYKWEGDNENVFASGLEMLVDAYLSVRAEEFS